MSRADGKTEVDLLYQSELLAGIKLHDDQKCQKFKKKKKKRGVADFKDSSSHVCFEMKPLALFSK